MTVPIRQIAKTDPSLIFTSRHSTRMPPVQRRETVELASVGVALPEQMRGDRHGFAERFGPRPLMHTGAVRDGPAAVSTFVLIEVAAPPGVEAAGAVSLPTHQLSDVVDLRGRMTLIRHVDRVVQDAVHRRFVTAMRFNDPCA